MKIVHVYGGKEIPIFQKIKKNWFFCKLKKRPFNKFGQKEICMFWENVFIIFSFEMHSKTRIQVCRMLPCGFQAKEENRASCVLVGRVMVPCPRGQEQVHRVLLTQSQLRHVHGLLLRNWASSSGFLLLILARNRPDGFVARVPLGYLCVFVRPHYKCGFFLIVFILFFMLKLSLHIKATKHQVYCSNSLSVSLPVYSVAAELWVSSTGCNRNTGGITERYPSGRPHAFCTL